ncbi:hypothetical protein [Variovorax sp. SRS16]|uniref:hypothetical protein n=1 Tax=Variovorax sp. SRS16 TaxID=282217 RepID=UPI0013A55A80|nr:hypothetical protein [Variovorax sp. SRS16]
MKMKSSAEKFPGYRRFFAWAFILSTMFLIGLLGAEFALLPSSSLGLEMSVPVVAEDNILRNVQLLSTIAALVMALVSFPGLIVSAVLVWLAERRSRKEMGLENALRHRQRFDPLRALRNHEKLESRASH